MNKFNKIFLLIITLIFLTTYNPIEFINFKKEEKFFFKIKYINITNNKIIESVDISKKLEHIIGKNIFFVKKIDINDPLNKIEFLDRIEVKKKYPNTIIIKVYETKPIAIVFKNNKKYLLDNLSNLISYKKISEDYYPNIFGESAEYNFANFFSKLKEAEFPYEMVKNYYYFQIGRWDLELINGKIIKLPANKTKKAFHLAIELLEHENFKNYNIIDLRIEGKVIVE
jgi:cell division protein FtsQ